jgi:hypothetical protein
MKLSNEEISALQRTLDFTIDKDRSSKTFDDWLYLQDYDLDTFPKATERAEKLVTFAKNALSKLREHYT